MNHTKILSDNRTEFKKKLFTQAISTLRIRHVFSYPITLKTMGALKMYITFCRCTYGSMSSLKCALYEVVHIARPTYNFVPDEHSKERYFAQAHEAFGCAATYHAHLKHRDPALFIKFKCIICYMRPKHKVSPMQQLIMINLLTICLIQLSNCGISQVAVDTLV